MLMNMTASFFALRAFNTYYGLKLLMEGLGLPRDRPILGLRRFSVTLLGARRKLAHWRPYSPLQSLGLIKAQGRVAPIERRRSIQH